MASGWPTPARCCTRDVIRGGSPPLPAPVVKALAGHSTLAVTQRYAHVTDERLKEAIGRLRGNSVVTEGPEPQDERVEGANKASK